MLANRILQVSWMGDIYLREVGGFKAPANVLAAVTGIAISCAIAWASWHLYESQFLKLKRFVPYGRGERRLRTAQPPPSVSEQPTMSVP
jgi:peptidoglycan/LPS O-acetylase OafA/YrhL